MNIVQLIAELTGYRQAAKQLEVLHQRGFWRAYILHGRVILERAHYDAVCAGAVVQGKTNEPTLKRAA